jgi:hypothetical protein
MPKCLPQMDFIHSHTFDCMFSCFSSLLGLLLIPPHFYFALKMFFFLAHSIIAWRESKMCCICIERKGEYEKNKISVYFYVEYVHQSHAKSLIFTTDTFFKEIVSNFPPILCFYTSQRFTRWQVLRYNEMREYSHSQFSNMK